MSEQDTQKIEEEVVEEEVLDAETEEIKKELGLEDADDKGDEEESKEETEEETKPEEVEEETEEDTEDEDSEDEDEDPEDVEPQEKEKRQVKSMPVVKHLKVKKKLTERIKELEEQNKGEETKAPAESAKDLKELADEYGVDEDFVSKLSEKILSKAKLPENVQKQLDELSAKAKEEKAEESFNKAIEALQSEYPNEPIGDYKEKIKELAYTEGHTEESAFELFFRHVKPTISTKKKTAEGSKSGGDVKKESVDYDDPNLDLDSLSDKEFDEYTEKQADKDRKLKII